MKGEIILLCIASSFAVAFLLAIGGMVVMSVADMVRRVCGNDVTGAA